MIILNRLVSDVCQNSSSQRCLCGPISSTQHNPQPNRTPYNQQQTFGRQFYAHYFTETLWLSVRHQSTNMTLSVIIPLSVEVYQVSLVSDNFGNFSDPQPNTTQPVGRPNVVDNSGSSASNTNHIQKLKVLVGIKRFFLLLARCKRVSIYFRP